MDENIIIISRENLSKLVRAAVDKAMDMERADVYVMEDVDDLVTETINAHVPAVVDLT